MPQLSIETFVSQYFWLVFILFALYFIMVTKLLPLISESFKARAVIDTKVKVQKNLVKDSLLIKDIASLQFSTSSKISSHNPIFTKNFYNWSSKVN